MARGRVSPTALHYNREKEKKKEEEEGREEKKEVSTPLDRGWGWEETVTLIAKQAPCRGVR